MAKLKPRADLATVVLDCADTEPMMRMYRALGGEPDPRNPGNWCLVLSGVTLSFQEIEGFVAPTWPKGTVPKQMHLTSLSIR